MLYKGAPPFSMSALYIIMNFNPRAPCGARQSVTNTKSTNSPFQSTRPMRGATSPRYKRSDDHPVSIHAPHAGRDRCGYVRRRRCHVSIHAPHAGRDQEYAARSQTTEFQSTRPVWGATFLVLCGVEDVHVSIHAPRVGRDTPMMTSFSPRKGFNPRAPCGARRRMQQCSTSTMTFQSTRPVWGATGGKT